MENTYYCTGPHPKTKSKTEKQQQQQKNTTVAWQTSWWQNSSSSNNTANTNKNNNYTYDINLQMWNNGDSPDSSTLSSPNVMVWHSESQAWQ